MDRTARGDLARRPLLRAQTADVLGFGAVAIAAVAATPRVGRFVLAAGWLGHAARDAVCGSVLCTPGRQRSPLTPAGRAAAFHGDVLCQRI